MCRRRRWRRWRQRWSMICRLTVWSVRVRAAGGCVLSAGKVEAKRGDQRREGCLHGAIDLGGRVPESAVGGCRCEKLLCIRRSFCMHAARALPYPPTARTNSSPRQTSDHILLRVCITTVLTVAVIGDRWGGRPTVADLCNKTYRATDLPHHQVI